MVPIITDSTCAFPPSLPDSLRNSIQVVRTTVQFGTDSYADGDLTLDEFYDRIRAGGVLPKTSQPSPEEYLRAYRSVENQGPALAIFLSSALSGTYSSGVALRGEVPGADIEVFDSAFFSSALGYMVAESAQMSAAGAGREAIVERLIWRRDRTSLFITVDTLNYLRMGGRINFLQTGLATLLDLKPILAVQDGRLVVVGRVRSRQRSLERLLKLAHECAMRINGPVDISVMHGHAQEEALWLLEKMRDRFTVVDSFVNDAPASLAVHGGPGVVGVVVSATSSN